MSIIETIDNIKFWVGNSLNELIPFNDSFTFFIIATIILIVIFNFRQFKKLIVSLFT